MKNGYHDNIEGGLCCCGSLHEYNVRCIYGRCSKRVTVDVRHEDNVTAFMHNGHTKEFGRLWHVDDVAIWLKIDCHPRPTGTDVPAAMAYFK